MLYDFVYYEKHSGKITGRFRTSTPHLLPKPPSPDHEQVRVTDEEHLKLLSDLDSTRSSLSGRVRDGKISTLTVSPRYQGHLELTTDHSDLDGDGVSELPADGTSTARVTVRIMDHEGRPIQLKGVRVAFRVTGGSLSAREVEARNGTANVDWKSTTETIQARVTASVDRYQETSLTLEFIPPDEYRALSSSGKK